MAKSKTQYVCQSCGYTSVKWQGKCPSCQEWNTLVEEIVVEQKNKSIKKGSTVIKTETLANYDSEKMTRIPLPENEFNRVVGGGIVPGSVILLSGEPGIGKSTLLLQLLLKLDKISSLYVSGEESPSQIKLRAQRIGLKNPNCHLFTETNLESIAQAIDLINPQMLIVDSIQTIDTHVLESTPGSISQIRECTSGLTTIAKTRNIPVILVGHINKEGNIAGPKVLEHMVDTVLYFEGDRNYDYRILRTIKNRFGAVSDIGIYEMFGKGLREIDNPSDILISHRDENISGISIASTLEGIRPLLIEIQALVTPTFYGMPQRNTTGFDNRRLSMLLAVLEKRCGLKLSTQDVFLNIAGGLKPADPSIDLAAISAIISSFLDIPNTGLTCFAGEVGLSGEIRPVKQLEKRISEAAKLGFENIIVSSYNKNIASAGKKIRVQTFDSVQKLITKLA